MQETESLLTIEVALEADVAFRHVRTGRMRKLFGYCLLLLSCGLQPLRADAKPSEPNPIAPFRIADNLYYVGSQDLASYLVVTAKGNILINANLASSPPQIRASVEALGFQWSDIRILLNSQAHSDHVGGAAEVVRETHAKNMVMDGDASVVETGAHTDFLYPSPNILTYAPVHVDRVLHDLDTVNLGGVTLTAHKTAGHTRGCTTWTTRSHVPGEQAGVMRNIVIVGGVGFWSEYHFVATAGHSASYSGISQDFQHTFSTLRALPCDIFLGAHGQYFDMLQKLKQYPQVGPRVFIDPAGYQAFVIDAEEAFKKALTKEETTPVRAGSKYSIARPPLPHGDRKFAAFTQPALVRLRNQIPAPEGYSFLEFCVNGIGCRSGTIPYGQNSRSRARVVFQEYQQFSDRVFWKPPSCGRYC